MLNKKWGTQDISRGKTASMHTFIVMCLSLPQAFVLYVVQPTWAATHDLLTLTLFNIRYPQPKYTRKLHYSESTGHNFPKRIYKKLSYRRETARCVVSIEILPIATQQCRNYLYDKSWPNRWYEVGDLVGGNA